MTISEQAATGSADREAVAIALGWSRAEYPGILWGAWHSPAGVVRSFSPPDYQNDLTATLAEIERRGWHYAFGSTAGYYFAIFTALFLGDAYDATGTTIANAAIAALLKALENGDDN